MIADLTLDSVERSIAIRKEHGICNGQAARERLHYIDANRWVIEQVNRMAKTMGEGEETATMESIRRSLTYVPPRS